jgi:hypothetical protein
LGVQVKVWRADHSPRYAVEAGIDLGDADIDAGTSTCASRLG